LLRLAQALDAIDPGWRGAKICVALSGGLDSTVLLHAMAALAAGTRANLRAIHVDHGLQAASPAWADACAAACHAASVPLEILTLRLAPSRGASVEAAAREARYAALAPLLADGEWLLTAHHRDDQLETVLIQLLRGSGVAGLAAMPARVAFGRGSHARPLLDFDRAELAAYAGVHGLAWIDDPMNLDARFDRGWLRSRVLPAVRERWPSASATVARSASHLAEASRLLLEIAQADAAGIVDEGRLSLEGLARLSRDRQVNLVRGWLREQGLRPPPAARLNARCRLS
jgi:tRNA(Ile)-lysidine synthase